MEGEGAVCWSALLFGIWMCVAAVDVVGCPALKGRSCPLCSPATAACLFLIPFCFLLVVPVDLPGSSRHIFLIIIQPSFLQCFAINSQKDQLVCLRLGLVKASCLLVCCLESGNQSGTEMLAGGFLPSTFLLGADSTEKG